MTDTIVLTPRAAREVLAYLAVAEGISAALLAPGVLAVAHPWGEARLALLFAGTALSVSLGAGSLFWWRRRHGHPTARTTLGCAIAHWLAAGAAVLAAVLSLVVLAAGTDPRPAVFALGLAVFALAEFVNYRWCQITAGGWRAWLSGRVIKPQLARELERRRRLAS